VKFDEYTRKARLAPVLIAALPCAVLVLYVPEFGLVVAAIPLILIGALALLTEQIVRLLGKAVEGRLVRRWGGLPTVHMLQLERDSVSEIVEARRRDVEQLSRSTLPSRAEERSHPSSSYKRYDDAVRRAIAVIGTKDDGLFRAENIAYGFRRNLLGLKVLAIPVLVGTSIANLALGLTTNQGTIVLIVAILLALDLLIWLVVVRPYWVKEQAQVFADRFFFSASVATRPE
jgi:hypothetical protein